ncbi:DEAD/DEAH box helicase, partial [Escherichia coli]|uniref:DEAD/DEAH box helicase n=1 Tax=Escherichia coli TaxID=562 RepID=UPI00142E3974
VKALCRERFDDWNPRFSKLGVSCIEVTGDGGDYFDLQGYNLIITTPEKWDSLTRKWRDNAGLVQMVKLLMIDEVHLLSDNKRGPV